MLKKVFLLLFMLFMVSYVEASTRALEELTTTFNLMDQGQKTPYDFARKSIDYWDDELAAKNISEAKYCAEIKGVRKIVEARSRSEHEAKKKSIDLLNDFLSHSRGFDQYCSKVEQREAVKQAKLLKKTKKLK